MEKGRQAPVGAETFKARPVIDARAARGVVKKVEFTLAEKLQIQQDAQRVANARVGRREAVSFPARVK